MWLADDIRRLQRGGWSILVSAIMPAEVAGLHLGAIGTVCELVGVEHVSFPIGNLQVPTDEQSIVLFEKIAERLRSGHNVAAHCHGSIGRSPLIVASLLVMAGVHPDDAWSRIRVAREEQVPDTYEQRDWVSRFARTNDGLDSAAPR
jgi:protein-tyrosine phosphatase